MKELIKNIKPESNSVHRAAFFQPKLTINQANDPYEQEADSVADKVMRMPINEQPFFSPKPVSVSGLQRKCAECEEEEKNLQRKEKGSGDTHASNELESYIGNINSSGTPLPGNVRSFFEPRFGYDFSNVKIHTDSVAAKSAQSVNALAYTSGNNIVFNKNQYSPETDSGKKLLAHELTHVVQQSKSNKLESDHVHWVVDGAYSKAGHIGIKIDHILPAFSAQPRFSPLIQRIYNPHIPPVRVPPPPQPLLLTHSNIGSCSLLTDWDVKKELALTYFRDYINPSLANGISWTNCPFKIGSCTVKFSSGVFINISGAFIDPYEPDPAKQDGFAVVYEILPPSVKNISRYLGPRCTYRIHCTQSNKILLTLLHTKPGNV
jgi:hypothetical protein